MCDFWEHTIKQVKSTSIQEFKRKGKRMLESAMTTTLKSCDLTSTEENEIEYPQLT